MKAKILTPKQMNAITGGGCIEWYNEDGELEILCHPDWPDTIEGHDH